MELAHSRFGHGEDLADLAQVQVVEIVQRQDLLIPLFEGGTEEAKKEVAGALVTLAVLTGLMIGSLRALWPWQTDDRDLLAPTQEVGSAAVAILVGMAIVAVLLVLERRLGLSEEQESSHVEPS